MRQEIKCSMLLFLRVVICLHAEFGGVSVFSVAERWSGVSLSCFEVVLCESDVRFCRVVVVACDGGLV